MNRLGRGFLLITGPVVLVHSGFDGLRFVISPSFLVWLMGRMPFEKERYLFRTASTQARCFPIPASDTCMVSSVHVQRSGYLSRRRLSWSD